MQEERHSLEEVDNINFVLDEIFLSYCSKHGLKLQSKTHVKIFLAVSKTEESGKEKLKGLDPSKIKFLQNAYYDMFVITDCDAAALFFALTYNDAKNRKRQLNEVTHVFVKMWEESNVNNSLR